METEFSKKNENTQITFKLSTPEERRRIEQKAAQFGISLSEYCRNKILSDNDATVRALSRVAELEQQLKAMRVELDYFKETQVEPNNIVLPLTSEQRELLEALFADFEEGYEGLSIGENIVAALVYLTLLDNAFPDRFFSGNGLTRQNVRDAFYDEEGHFKFS